MKHPPAQRVDSLMDVVVSWPLNVEFRKQNVLLIDGSVKLKNENVKWVLKKNKWENTSWVIAQI